MFLKPVCLAFLVLMPGLALPAPDTIPAQHAPELQLDQVLERNYQARGGLDKLRALRSFRMTMDFKVKDQSFPMTIEARRPARFRAELNVSGALMIQAFDGKTGWVVNPLSSQNHARMMGKAERNQIENQADIDGPLVDWKLKGHALELLGREKLPEGDFIKLKITMKGGQEFVSYLDANTFLEVKQITTRTIEGNKVEGESIFGDYRPVNGLLFPYKMESGPKGSENRQTITVKSIELDPELNDDRFTEPPQDPAPPKSAVPPKPADAPKAIEPSKPGAAGEVPKL